MAKKNLSPEVLEKARRDNREYMRRKRLDPEYKALEAERNKQSLERHKEQINARRRERRINNPDLTKAEDRKWRLKHRLWRNAQRRLSRANAPELAREQARVKRLREQEQKRTNPERVKQINREHYARTITASLVQFKRGRLTFDELNRRLSQAFIRNHERYSRHGTGDRSNLASECDLQLRQTDTKPDAVKDGLLESKKQR